MKKIWSFTTVKDEEDIIESFVRYNMNIFDGMVISDNGSNDSTLDILYKLKEEGYNIDILVDESKYFDQLVKRNELLKHTMECHNPDFAFPLDADELVCTTQNVNPKNIINKLDKNYLHKYRLRNYVLTGKETNELFVPKRITTYRIDNENLPGNYKCFISNTIFEKGLTLEIGSHGAHLNNNEKLQEKILEKLYIAHFPVRSKYQIINKTITGRLNNLSLHSREEGFGFHQYEILDEIVKLGTISDETLLDISKTYMIYDKNTKVKYKKSPIDLSFCKNLELKYTKTGNDDTLLANTIKTSVVIINHMREENKREYLEFEKNAQEYNKIINSKTWRMRNRVIKLFRLGEFKKTKDK